MTLLTSLSKRKTNYKYERMDFKMKKSMKKIATSLVATSMVLGTVSTAFASNAPTTTIKVDDETVYSVVGDVYADAEKQWKAESEDCIMTKDGNSYVMDLGALTAKENYQFKIVMNGPDEAWNYQLLYGTQYFGDNCSQLHFDLAQDAADVKVTYNPYKGTVEVTADGNAVDLTVSVLSDERAFNSNERVAADTAAKYAASYLNLVKDEKAILGESTLTLVGGITEWNPQNLDLIMKSYDANTASYYLTTAELQPGDYEFQIVKDGEDSGWNYQLWYATTEFADNCSQFKVSLTEAGTLTVLVNPYDGSVKVYEKVGEELKEIPFTVRISSRDEDSTDFVEPSREASAEAFKTRFGKDANTETAIDTAIAFPVAEPAAPAEDPTAPSEDPTAPTEAPTTVAPTQAPTTAAPAGTKTAPAATKAAAATTAKNQATQTGDVAPVALFATLVASVAVVTIAAKKKEA